MGYRPDATPRGWVGGCTGLAPCPAAWTDWRRLDSRRIAAACSGDGSTPMMPLLGDGAPAVTPLRTRVTGDPWLLHIKAHPQGNQTT